jgi:hypothetical protein
LGWRRGLDEDGAAPLLHPRSRESTQHTFLLNNLLQALTQSLIVVQSDHNELATSRQDSLRKDVLHEGLAICCVYESVCSLVLMPERTASFNPGNA